MTLRNIKLIKLLVHKVANAHRSFVQNQNLIKNVPQIDLNFDEQEQVDQDSLSGNEDEENLVKNLE